MRAVRFDRVGDPDVLEVVDIEEPHAGPGQVRVAVRAAGVNPVDWKIRGGTTLRSTAVPLPHVPGLEAAGIVDEVGDGVVGVTVGDAVFGAGSAASAQYAVLEHWADVPAGLGWEEAGGLALAVETAARGLDLLGIEPGTTLVVHGGAGGVGTAAVQLARARGATVLATAGPANQEYLRGLGAVPTTYGPGLGARLRELAPRGVDRALDVSGSGDIPELVALTGHPDRVVSIGDATAPEYGVRFTTGSEGRAFGALEVVTGLVAEGRFTMPVARAFPFTDAPAAHRASETGHVQGKFVLVPD